MTMRRDVSATRRRLLWSLVATVGLGSTGNIAAVSVGTIAAAELSGTTALSGAPGAMVVLGSAAGSYLLSSLMVRRGRRSGLAMGYALGVLGAIVAVTAVSTRSLPLLFVGTFLIGFGGSSNQLSRYAAADMFPIARRASAIATVVWGATIGAIVGPNLISSAGTFAVSNGLPAVAGAYLIPAVFVGIAAALTLLILRPDPYELAHETVHPDGEPAVATDPRAATRVTGGVTAPSPFDDQPAVRAATENVAADARSTDDVATAGRITSGGLIGLASLVEYDHRLRDLLARPTVLAALTVLVVGQISMTVVMTMTPLHITEHGGGLAAVGFVISAHTFGMYALAPLSGRLVDRFGSQPIVLVGLSTLAISGLVAAASPADGGPMLLAALFLLGYGWNLGFVAGSNMLASGLALAERTRLQGVTDTIIWGSAAVASLASGVIVALVSYTGLGVLPALLVMTPAWLIVRRRRAALRSLSGDAAAG